MARFVFPRWSNKVVPLALVLVGLLLTSVAAGITYYGTNKHVEVGYTPQQPVDYSHKLHAGDLGMDCRYCHTTVEKSAKAAVPATQTCMNCHAKVRTDSEKLLPVRESYATDQPIPWVRVHNLPDFVYFDHSAHLNGGVGCESCHGRVDQMVKVSQVQPLSMGWCLDCHRDPTPHLRDPKDVTKMGLLPSTAAVATGNGAPTTIAANYGVGTANGRKVNPPVTCSGCHR